MLAVLVGNRGLAGQRRDDLHLPRGKRQHLVLEILLGHQGGAPDALGVDELHHADDLILRMVELALTTERKPATELPDLEVRTA